MTHTDNPQSRDTSDAIRAVNQAAIEAHTVLHKIRDMGPKANAILFEGKKSLIPWQITEKFLAIHDVHAPIDQKIQGYAKVIGKASAYADFLGREDICASGNEEQKATLLSASEAMKGAIAVLRKYAIDSLHVSEVAVDEEIAKAQAQFKTKFDLVKPHRNWLSKWAARLIEHRPAQSEAVEVGAPVGVVSNASREIISDAIFLSAETALIAARNQVGANPVRMDDEKWKTYLTRLSLYAAPLREKIDSQKTGGCLIAAGMQLQTESPDSLSASTIEKVSQSVGKDYTLNEQETRQLEIALLVGFSAVFQGRPNPRLTTEDKDFGRI